MAFSKKDIKKLADEYVSAMEDNENRKDEYYGTPKEVGEDFIQAFVKFLVEKKV